MKQIEQYSGIIISVIYALVIRYLAEFGLININSSAYLIITPMIVGFIPFFWKPEIILKSLTKTIVFPLFSTLIFLIIAVIGGIEELLCFIIIGFPYIIISVTISVILRVYLKKRNLKQTNKNYLSPLLFLPIAFSFIEKEFKIETKEYITSNTIVINQDRKTIWNNLYAVPNISGLTQTSFVNTLGVPKPIKSTYNKNSNIRLGYFDNGMILFEKVTTESVHKKLSFAIDFEKSTIKQSPTLTNVVNEKTIDFKEISYELFSINKNETKVKLYCRYNITSNLQTYGSSIADIILADFELNLLKSLKRKLENK